MTDAFAFSFISVTAFVWPVTETINLFPPQGLNQSLHVPIFVGLVLLSYFREAYGWTYAGIVVPGYLAAVFSVAPVSGLVVVFEALVTYAIVYLLGSALPRLGIWSTFFGRERFFLFIVVAIIVRLSAEAILLPRANEIYPLAHSIELYSLGLVLVPLTANTFWNAGLMNAGPRLAILTGITFLFLQFLLLYTNYSLSRFEIANQSGAIQFLESPKAHLVLLVGALLAARSNVLHGWDFNGIIVPALLAVAVYSPISFVFTIFEAVLLFVVASRLALIYPFSRILMVGTRKVFFVFTLAIIWTWIAGMALSSYAPEYQFSDYMAFGYLLPSLLAVKMWDKNRVGVVVFPSIQVAVTAFLVANLLGFGLNWLLPGEEAERQTIARPEVMTVSSGAYQLILGDTTPSTAAAPSLGTRERALTASALSIEITSSFLHRGVVSHQLLQRSHELLQLAEDPQGWLIVTPASLPPDKEHPAPRISVKRGSAGSTWMIVTEPDSSGSPLPALAYRLATTLEAGTVALRSRHVDWRQFDDVFLKNLAGEIGSSKALVIEISETPGLSLQLRGSTPSGLNISLIEQVFDQTVEIEWTSGSQTRNGNKDNASPRLRIGRAEAERIGSAILGSPEPQIWDKPLFEELTDRIDDLTAVGMHGYVPPTPAELRLFDSVFLPLLSQTEDWEPSPWNRALADRLGYSYVKLEDGDHIRWGLVEPYSPYRRGNASWLSKDSIEKNAPVIEVPAPLWESGVFGAGLAFSQTLDTSAILLAGAFPNADPLGLSDPRQRSSLQSYYQRAHELLLMEGGTTISIRGTNNEQWEQSEVVLSVGREVSEPGQLPSWLVPVYDSLVESSFNVGLFDASLKHLGLAAWSDPTMAFATRFAEDRHAFLWLSPPIRQSFSGRGAKAALDSSITGLATESGDPAERAFDLARSSWSGEKSRLAANQALRPACNPRKEAELLNIFRTERNPHALQAGNSKTSCTRVFIEDENTKMPWAIVATTNRAFLIPLGEGPKRPIAGPLSDYESTRRMVTLGISTIEIEVVP